MLRSLKALERFSVSASPASSSTGDLEQATTDHDVGSVIDFLVEDDRWVVRYLTVHTTGFFKGRDVLISPIFFREVDWERNRFHLALTKEQVRDSPGVDLDRPVSRQYERDYYGYYGYPNYWGYGAGLWGMGSYASDLAIRKLSAHAEDLEGSADDIHLRSAKELRGYHIQGTDEPVGHVADFIFDDRSWAIRYLVIDTSNWWVGKKVLIAPKWASRIEWDMRRVHVDLTREKIKNSPEWNGVANIPRDYETRLFAHYGRAVYWAGADWPEIGAQMPRQPTAARSL